MAEADRDMLLRIAAFEHVRRLGEIHDHHRSAKPSSRPIVADVRCRACPMPDRDRLARRFERFKMVA
jgi:hypothetical protein